MSLNNPRLALEVWTRWRALGRRLAPSVVADEPTILLDDVLQIENLYNALTEPVADEELEDG